MTFQFAQHQIECYKRHGVVSASVRDIGFSGDVVHMINNAQQQGGFRGELPDPIDVFIADLQEERPLMYGWITHDARHKTSPPRLVVASEFTGTGKLVDTPDYALSIDAFAQKLSVGIILEKKTVNSSGLIQELPQYYFL